MFGDVRRRLSRRHASVRISQARSTSPAREALWYHFGIVPVMAMTLRIDDELEKALAELAEAEGTSRQEIVRRAVLERHARSGHVARVQESSARLSEKWGDVLHRLGTA